MELGINKVVLLGELGTEPVLDNTIQGTLTVYACVVTNVKTLDRHTDKETTCTEWHRVVFRDALADMIMRSLTKGTPIYVEGRMETRRWKNTKGKVKYTTEIIADHVAMPAEAISDD